MLEKHKGFKARAVALEEEGHRGVKKRRGAGARQSMQMQETATAPQAKKEIGEVRVCVAVRKKPNP